MIVALLVSTYVLVLFSLVVAGAVGWSTVCGIVELPGHIQLLCQVILFVNGIPVFLLLSIILFNFKAILKKSGEDTMHPKLTLCVLLCSINNIHGCRTFCQRGGGSNFDNVFVCLFC